jgi:Tfp pilus assembly protein PilX
MDWLPTAVPSRERGAALIIVLALVVLLTGVSIAYLSRTTSDRQVAHSSFNQSNVDQLAQSALDNIIGDLRQEIANGSSARVQDDGTTVYLPTAAANMVPQRSGNAAVAPNLIRRSVRSDVLNGHPGVPSRASAVNSTTDISANGRSVTLARWNTHYLLPKYNTGTDDSYPPSPLLPPFNPNPAVPNGFTPPDWVFVTTAGATPSPAPADVIGRYAYAVYDEGGLLDMNVAGYPTGTTPAQFGRKGSVAYVDLTALGNYPIPNPNTDNPPVYQVDRIVGWRNYATTQPTNNFPDTGPPANKAFAYNFQTGTTPATNFYNYVVNNGNGFLSPSTAIWNGRMDQIFIQRQELIAFRKTTGFSANALQYLSTFSRETNAPSFSPSTPAGSTIDYAALANTATAVNPNFLSRRVTSSFTRFDDTTAVVGEPLVKTRFPLSRLAWITYKGPSASLATTDPVYTALINAGVSATTISAGTTANIQACFGLTFGGNTGDPWTYSHGAADRILRLDEVAAARRDADFFELLQAGILSGSLGQDTGGPGGTRGVTGGNVFPDVHMNSSMQHLLTIGACIIDQADPDSIPTRIQFTGITGSTWTAYGIENLPYITQMYPIAGTSWEDSSKWATYLLFQLWNPHQNAGALPAPVRLRVNGGIGIFTGGNAETWNTSNPPTFTATGQAVTLNSAASFSAPAPLSNQNTPVNTAATQGNFGGLPFPPIP